jgi:P-type E1-E2 ATPase
MPEWVRLQNALLVAIEVDGEVLGVIGLDDPVRSDSRKTIDSLRKLGVRAIELVSGDRLETVTQVAEAVGIDTFHADCTPEDKLSLVQSRLRSPNGVVVVVGDGINDAPALMMATVGVALGAKGATAASEAADVVIVEDEISRLSDAIRESQIARNRALQASAVGMSLAAGTMVLSGLGILNPTEAAVTQEFIDASAILWALVPAKRNRKI